MFRTLAKLLRFGFTALFILAAVSLAVSNRAKLELTFYPLPYAFEIPIYLFGILVFAAGLLLGWIISSAATLKMKRAHKASSGRISALENELSALRAEQTLRSPQALPLR